MAEVPLYIKNLMYLFAAIYMLSVMLESTSGKVVTMLKDRRRMGLALLANLVVVPLLVLFWCGYSPCGRTSESVS